MLAPTDQRDIRLSHANLHTHGPQMPRPVFRAAYKELCTRIWIELELLAQANSAPRQDLTMSTAILRLELIVLIDSCRSPRWSRLLTTDQRDSLCSMLTDVLAALYVEPDRLPAALIEAQDRVLDELLPDPDTDQPQPSPAPAYEFHEASHPAINELLSIVEAQAAARALQ